MKCVLKETIETENKWYSWCGKIIQHHYSYNYSFTAELDRLKNGDVCQDCSMALIRKLLCVAGKEHLAMLI
jgi:hypothetical protein